MRSDATTVAQYLAELPDERRQALEEVRRVILDNLPEGYEEVMNWGMISYEVPFEIYPDTYNGQPLGYVGLASQKNHMALYLSSIYAFEGVAEEFENEYRATGKRYDVGKSCVRFRKLVDLPLELIGKTIAATPMDEFIARYEESRTARRKQ